MNNVPADHKLIQSAMNNAVTLDANTRPMEFANVHFRA